MLEVRPPAAPRLPPSFPAHGATLASDLAVGGQSFDRCVAAPGTCKLINMQRGVQEIQVALRVLSALTYRETPDQQDVEELHRTLSAGNYDSLDEMACAVIEQALEHRRRVRDAGQNAEDQLTRARCDGSENQ